MKFRPIYSHLDAFFVSLMVGVGESYLVAGALEAGVSPVSAGLLIPFSMVLGALLSSLGLPKLEKLQSLKKLVVSSIFFQALCFLPLVALVFFEIRSELGFLLAVTLYYFFGFLSAPVWNLWLSHLVSSKETSNFFSFRLRVSQAGLLLGLVFGGFFLHGLWGDLTRLQVFAWLFVLALICRIISGIALSKLPDVTSAQAPLQSHNLSTSLKIFFGNSSYRSFFGFLFCFYLVIAVSSPFVSPFFLLELKFSYNQYMGALAALFVGKFLVLPWGVRWIEKWGVRRIILIGALGISPLPAFWIWFRGFEQAVLLQMVSGAFWALFEMGFTVLFFDHLTKEEKIPLLNLYNLFNAVAMGIGSLIGALLLQTHSRENLSYSLIYGWGAGCRTLLVLLIIFFGVYRNWPKKVNEPLELPMNAFSPTEN